MNRKRRGLGSANPTEENTVRRLSVTLFAAAAMVAASCTQAPEPEVTTTTTAPVPTTSATIPDYSDFDVRLGVITNLGSPNGWALYGRTASVYDALVFQGQPAFLYTSAAPTYTRIPVLAEQTEPPAGEPDGDTWVIDVALKTGITWSDGEPVNADDIVFTFDVVESLGLGGNFEVLWPVASPENTGPGLIDVEALDPHTVRYTWDRRPGLARWQHGVAYAPILPEHYWSELVAGVTTPQDLYQIDGLGAPGFGSMVAAGLEPGSSALNVGNTEYPYRGSSLTVYGNGAIDFFSFKTGTVELGGTPAGDPLVEYSEEFIVSEMPVTMFSNRDDAGAALIERTISFWANPLPMWPDFGSLRRRFTVEGGITNASIPGSTLYYLAFNTRRFPGNDIAFRQAVDCMLHKSFITDVYMAEAVDDVDSTVLPSAGDWHNPATASTCAGQSKGEKMESAVQILKTAGWTWDKEPVFDPDGDAGFGDVIPGEGLRGPNGEEISPISMPTASPVYDPVRATYSFWAQVFITELGIPVTAVPTDFHGLQDRIDSLDWDMYISGWGVGDVFPNHVVTMFHSNNDSARGGANTSGYASEEFDQLATRFLEAVDVSEARELGYELQQTISRDVPIVMLYTSDLHYSFRRAPESPFPDLIYLMNKGVGGLPGLIKRS